MKCPACSNPLEHRTGGTVSVEICTRGCAGIWFDRSELSHVDEFQESFPEELIRALSNATVAIDRRRARSCPRCPEVVLIRETIDDEHRVEVDECPGCGGQFLDLGELALLREQSRRDADSAKKWQSWLDRHRGKLTDSTESRRYRAFFEVIFK